MTIAQTKKPSAYPADIEAIATGRHGNPFVVLGMQGGNGAPLAVNVFAPQATAIELVDRASGEAVASLSRLHAEGFFSAFIPSRTERFDYQLRLSSGDQSWVVEDPYRFPPVLGEKVDTMTNTGNWALIRAKWRASRASLLLSGHRTPNA